MKKKYLSALMAVCLFSAFPSALNCQCMDTGCGFVSKAVRTNVPQCHPHPVAVHSKENGNSAKECCGKCRIEKTAVLSNEFSPLSDIRPGNTLEEIKSFADFYSKIQRPSFFQEGSAESPPGFFAEYILNTTFSFRAPPQGGCFR